MGKSKRIRQQRQANLAQAGINKAEHDVFFSREAQQRYQRHLISSYREWQAMLAEAAAIECRLLLGHDVSDFTKGCLAVYEALRLMTPPPTLEKPSWHETNTQVAEIVSAKLKEAGEMLNASGGLKDMQDPLLWSFIPQNVKRLVDFAFDGIGEWLA